MPSFIEYSGVTGQEPIEIESQTIAPIIEPLDGPVSVDDVFFGRFHESVYQQGRDTHIYRLLKALCGDAGAGFLKKQGYFGRLSQEIALNWQELESLYTQYFRFKRLPEEKYFIDTDLEALTPDDWLSVEDKDNKYRERFEKFMQSARLGCTPEGMELAACAGSGVETDVVENYHYVFDQYSDDQLSLEPQGQSTATGEFILDVHLVDRENNILRESAAVFVDSAAYEVGDSVRPTPFRYNGHIYEVTVAGTSGAEPTVWPTGDGDTITSGGVTFQEAGEDISISYTADLSRNPTFTGPTWPVVDYKPVPISTYLTNIYEWGFTDVTYLAPHRERNSLYILDELKPVDTLVSIKQRQQRHIPIEVDNRPFASSERIHMSRFVTGRDGVEWPVADSQLGNFIEKGIEKEAIYQIGQAIEIPTIFNTIEGIISYTDHALLDENYNSADFYETPQGQPTPYTRYTSEHSGRFNKMLLSIFAFMKNIPDNAKFRTKDAIAINNTPIVMVVKRGELSS